MSLAQRIFRNTNKLFHNSIQLRAFSQKIVSVTKNEPTDSNLKQLYDQNGFIVIKDLLNTNEIKQIKDEMTNICAGLRGNIHGINPKLFKTENEVKNMNESEIEKQFYKHYYCIHFPHKMSEIVLNMAAKHEKTTQVLQKIIGPDVKMIQTMMFLKGPGRVGQNWHQDEFYIPTRDCSLTGAWIAIEDAYVDNGCLWVLPGSHKKHIIYPTESHGLPDLFDGTPVCHNFEPFNENTDAIPVKLNKGDGIFFSGYLLHRSLKNNTNNSYRLSFANHYMNANSMLPWNYDGRLEGVIEDSRDIVMVSGNDPYKWKGIQDLKTTNPFVRGSEQFKDAST